MKKLSCALAFSVALLCSTARADLVLDLTTAGSSQSTGAVIGGTFVVQQISPQSTGTGVIDPFLRIQGNQGSEEGYNTDAQVEYDAKAGTWTHALMLSAIPIVNIGGVDYRQFLLDINQNTGGPQGANNNLLSLSQIQLFQAAADVGNGSETLTPATATEPSLISFVGGTEIFRMNNASDPNTEIKLNYDLNPGSGAGDMFLYVRADAFTGPGQFVVMYSQFGTPPGVDASNDGFEEWATLRPAGTVLVPEPGSILMLGSAVVFAGLKLRNRFKKAA